MPLLWLSLAFLLGIPLAAQTSLPLWVWILLGGICLAWSLARWLWARRRPSPAPAAPGLLGRLPLPAPALLLALALGGIRQQLAQPDLGAEGFIASYIRPQQAYILEGVVIQPPDERDSYTNLRVESRRLRPAESLLFAPVSGLLLARLPAGGEWQYGDLVRLQGELQIPPEDEEFSYRDYLARQGIYAFMPQARAERVGRGQGSPFLRVVYAFKARAQAMVYRLYPDPEASLLAGILLGVESGIPAGVKEAFQATGTAHIIAISGFNITILAGLFALVFGRVLGRWRGALAAVLGIALYTLLVGAEAAVVRAAILGGFSVFAAQIGRRQHGLNSLAFIAALMAGWNPSVLWDVGFQLSFAATLGLVLYAEPLIQGITLLVGRFLPPATLAKVSRWVGEYFLFTLAAQVTTLPVIAYHFRRISIIALLANPLVLPAQPAVMVLGGISVLLGMLYAPLGELAARLAWPFVVYTIRIVELLGQAPGASLVLGQVDFGAVLLFYIVLLGLTVAWPQRARLKPILKPSLALAALGIAALLAWRAAWAAPDGRLHLTVLEVSTGAQSGESLLIETPEGRYVLVNGGPSASALSDALGRRLPLGARRIDWLVVASPAQNQVAALPRLVERYPPQGVLWAGATHGTAAARDLQQTLNSLGIRPTLAESGHVLDLGQGARLQVLSAGARGAVLLLEWGSFRALLPLGLDAEQLDDPRFLQSLPPVTALLLAESGYAPANPPEWIARLQPQVVLLSVAAGDREGRPNPEILEAVEGYTLLRTDQNGWIELSTDGEQLWVEAAR